MRESANDRILPVRQYPTRTIQCGHCQRRCLRILVSLLLLLLLRNLAQFMRTVDVVFEDSGLVDSWEIPIDFINKVPWAWGCIFIGVHTLS